MSNESHIEIHNGWVHFGFDFVVQLNRIVAVWRGSPEKNKDGEDEYRIKIQGNNLKTLVNWGPYSRDEATEIVREFFDVVTLMT
jgi:hypothetical protein